MTFNILDFDLSGNTDRWDLSRAVVVTEGFRWLKEFGAELLPSDRVPAEPAENPEEWEIVSEIHVDETYFDGCENKWEICGKSTLLIAPVKETEKPEFFKFEDEAAALGFDEYA